jgi:hypothetical protein
MPEQNPESKPSEKPEEKPSTPPEGTQPQGQPRQGRGGRQYVDYNALTPEEAAIMLKRIRARINRIRNALSMIEKDLGVITNILKFGANAGTPSQGQGQQAQQGQSEYSRGYRRGNYGNSGYSGRGSYGGRSYGGGYSRYSGRRGRRTSSEEDEDVNY